MQRLVSLLFLSMVVHQQRGALCRLSLRERAFFRGAKDDNQAARNLKKVPFGASASRLISSSFTWRV